MWQLCRRRRKTKISYLLELMRNYLFFLRNKAPLFGQKTLFVLSRPLWERLRGSMFFFVISSRPKWKERISFPSVPQDRHSIPMWKPVNGWERTCHLLPCFQLPSAMGERERSFHASNPSCCLPSTRYFYKWFFCKRICQMFFLGNCRQSYNLNKEYLRKNRRIFGFFQTGWEGLPPDSHFHCFLCFLNWHGQLQEDFYPFFLEIVLNPVLDTALKAKVLEQISNELPDFSCSPR